MTERNPYVISFGKIPSQYISRSTVLTKKRKNEKETREGNDENSHSISS